MINIANIVDPSFYKKYMGTDELKLSVIIPTGACNPKMIAQNLAIATDMLFVPEIVNLISNILKSNNIRSNIDTILDIDFIEDMDKYDACNLLIVGSNEVNIAAYELNTRQNHGVGFIDDDQKIYGSKNDKTTIYRANQFPNYGFLHITENANNDRFMIFSAGMNAIGTMGSNLLLKNYLTRNYTHNQQNNYNIVNAIVREYHNIDSMLPKELLTPSFEIKNIVNLEIIE